MEMHTFGSVIGVGGVQSKDPPAPHSNYTETSGDEIFLRVL
jgi:hypothetical protein